MRTIHANVTVVFSTFVLLMLSPSSAMIGRLFRGRGSPVIEDTPARTFLPPKILDNRGLDYIFDKNQAWKESKLASDKNFFNKLANSGVLQPEFMYIGDAGSPVPENLMMGEEAANIIVHRNIAGVVGNTDMNLLSTLQYAVNECNVQDIIVCGNYESGGIKAALSAASDRQNGGPLEAWLQRIREVYRLHDRKLNAIEDPNERLRSFVEVFVIEQCINILKFDVVKRRRKTTFFEGDMTPRVHATAFDPKTGDLKRIPFGFAEYSDVGSEE